MINFGFPGINNIGYGYPFPGNPPLPRTATSHGLAAGTGEHASEENGKSGKNPVVRFLKGFKDEFVNTVKALFSIKGFLVTAATMGLVMATGGAALIPLALIGGVLGGTKMVKGAIHKNPEQMGGGLFIMLSSLGGLKLAPKTVGTETLADPSLWGKMKAPFVGRGIFQNSDAHFWGASFDATANALGGMKTRLFGGAIAGGTGEETSGLVPEGMEKIRGAFSKAKSGEGLKETKSWFSQDEVFPRSTSVGEAMQGNPGIWQKLKDLVTGKSRENTKAVLGSASPGPNQNGTNGQGVTGTTHVTFSDRAKNYLESLKDSPHPASAVMGSVFAGTTVKEKSAGKEKKNAMLDAETIYY